MKCLACGAELPEGTIFCTSCGTKLEPVQDAFKQPAADNFSQPDFQQPVADNFSQPDFQQPVADNFSQPDFQQPSSRISSSLQRIISHRLLMISRLLLLMLQHLRVIHTAQYLRVPPTAHRLSLLLLIPAKISVSLL